MQGNNRLAALLLGVGILLGFSALGYQLGQAAISYKQLDRTVVVKGLSEREYPADIVIWPIQFSVAGNQLQPLYDEIDRNTRMIREFLMAQGISEAAISSSPPSLMDKSAQAYGNSSNAEFRYTAQQSVTVYSDQIDQVRAVMNSISELGKQGIVFTGMGYGVTPQYLFTRLNEVKPAMIEEATRNAREVAEKFAEDSQSTLGKIRKASQGQFSISARDTNNPQIKKLRVVSTVEYYLSD
ncbi:SIMPL domain-containing protein [Marinobacterium sp. YM272]|uniref:SIMPL domain-containing protein n=1 Tax=Marinobacterium sp. YM272 TaxID=3421654 RepID=UPI003D7FFB4C